MFDFSVESIVGFLYAIPGVLFALSVHEFAHGFVAYKLGDPTARNMGRLTLNPIKHVDFFGLITMFVVGVGWAKLVPVDIRNFKKPRRDIALTSVAGPLANFISAFVGMILYYIFLTFIFFNEKTISNELLSGLIQIFQNFILLNIGLAIFNLIPIPPLDGSKILDSFLPPRAFLAYHKYESIIRIVLFAVLIFDVVSISPAIIYIYNTMSGAVDFIFGNIINLIIL